MDDLDALLEDVENTTRSRSSSKSTVSANTVRASKRFEPVKMLDLDKELAALGLDSNNNASYNDDTGKAMAASNSQSNDLKKSNNVRQNEEKRKRKEKKNVVIL
jgi:hypothetical protein